VSHPGLDRVRLRLSNSVVVSISWEESQELKARCVAAGGDARGIAEQLENVGVSRPADVTIKEYKLALFEIITGWIREAGITNLPPGIRGLYDALIPELASS